MLRRIAAGLALALLLLAAPAARASDPNALWRIVHDHCVPEQQAHERPLPCESVSVEGGWALLKDRNGVAQYLLIPTARVSGIEDAAVLAPDAPDYFAAAWAARGDVLARLERPLPRDALSLAINSAAGRSQNQLHIHIDCIRPDVRATLRRDAGAIGPQWAKLPADLRDHPYVARRLDGTDLDQANPFRVLADMPGVGAGGIGAWTLAVAAVDGGFVLLADRGNPATGDRAEAEELLDHDCALAHGGG